jgi:Zn/Cd-binding protein ZinT
MSSGYHGKWNDFFIELKVGESAFVKCPTNADKKTFSSRMDYYSKMFKRKFKSTTIDNQIKVTRVA